jgi:polar amino acid transport system substrate-binding protein
MFNLKNFACSMHCLLLMLLINLPSAYLSAEELLLYTEEWPPLNFTRENQLTGYSVELVQALSQLTGDQVKIESVPWTRGYGLAQQQANTGLFSVGRIAERESLFQWVGPFVSSQNRFYTLKGSPLKINSLADARQHKLAMPRLWYSVQYLQSQGFDDIYTVTSPEIMMNMFRNGRSDLLAASDVTLPYVLALAGLTPDDVVPQYSFMEHSSYLVFSPVTDPHVVERWQKAFEQLRRDGTVARLQTRWLGHIKPEQR